jgi:hypothetical protein
MATKKEIVTENATANATAEVKSSYEILSTIDMSRFIEDKSGKKYVPDADKEKSEFEKKKELKYISWVHAMNILYYYFPDAEIEILRYDGLPYYQTPIGYFVEVKVSLTCPKLQRIVSRTCILPVLDYSNKPVTTPNAFHINTTQQRAIAKCIAYQGLGLSVYAGEDLPINQYGADEVVVKTNGKSRTEEVVLKVKAENETKAIEKKVADEVAEIKVSTDKKRLISKEMVNEIETIWVNFQAIEKLSPYLHKKYNCPLIKNLTLEQGTEFLEWLRSQYKKLQEQRQNNAS